MWNQFGDRRRFVLTITFERTRSTSYYTICSASVPAMLTLSFPVDECREELVLADLLVDLDASGEDGCDVNVDGCGYKDVTSMRAVRRRLLLNLWADSERPVDRFLDQGLAELPNLARPSVETARSDGKICNCRWLNRDRGSPPSRAVDGMAASAEAGSRPRAMVRACSSWRQSARIRPKNIHTRVCVCACVCVCVCVLHVIGRESTACHASLNDFQRVSNSNKFHQFAQIFSFFLLRLFIILLYLHSLLRSLLRMSYNVGSKFRFVFRVSILLQNK